MSAVPGGVSAEAKISDRVLAKAIRSHLGDAEAPVKVLRKDIRPATKPGDNYVSVVYQVGVTYSLQEDPTPFHLQLIVKCIQEDAAFEGLVKESRVFEKEQLMYETVLPALEALAGSVFAPRCLLVEDGPHQLMVFHDLKELGYRMADRRRGLDFAHCQLVLRKLADFHATSMAFLRQRAAGEFPALGQGMSADPLLVEVVFKSYLDRLAHEVEGWAEPEFAGLRGKLQRVQAQYWEVYKRPLQADHGPWQVINHGDAWCNNFMFAYDATGLPADVVLLDHQMPFLCSPGYDLHYFLVTSPDLHTRLHRERDLLATYQEAFNGRLRSLGIRDFVVTGATLEEALRRKSPFGFTMMLTLLPLIRRTVPEEGQGAEDRQEAMRRMQEELFANEDFIATLKCCLRKFLDLGAFEEMLGDH